MDDKRHLARVIAVHTTQAWRPDAEFRHKKLVNDLSVLGMQPGPPLAEIAELTSELEDIKSVLWSASADEIWSRLHRVEERIALVAQGALLLEYATLAIDLGHDPAVSEDKDLKAGAAWKHVAKVVNDGRLPASTNGFPSDVKTVLHQAHMAIDERHFDANDCHRRLQWAIGGLAALSISIVGAAVLLKDLPFLVGAENFKGVPAIQIAALVALGGLVGGAWGALPAFVATRRDRYRLQYVRAGTRLALGVLSALIGVSLVGAGWVTGLTGDSAPALFAVAIAFGLAQEPVTKLLEGKLGKAVSESVE